MPNEIQSVTGAVPAVQLGSVLVHEHVACTAAGALRSWPWLAGGTEALIGRATEALSQARRDGIDTIVDATPFDLGRDVELLAEASRRSGVTIIASTGHWLFPSPMMANRTVAELADLYIHDLDRGADGTQIRCGVIKVASEDEITPFDERVIEAAAIAHRETDAPIITHAKAVRRIGEAQADRFDRLGVDPTRVVIGHSDDTRELDYLAGLADRGFLVGMDRIPNGALAEYGGQTVEGRIRMIHRLIEAGFGDRVVVAHDDPIWAGVLSAEDQQRHTASNPAGISFISRVVLPALLELGVDRAAIQGIMVDNPRRWLIGPNAA